MISNRVLNGIVRHKGGVDKVLTENDYLTERLISIEKTIAEFRLSMALPGRGDMKSQIAKNIYSLAGLRESLLWPRRSLRYPWIVLFFLGMVGTSYYTCANTAEYLNNPTATVVKFIPQVEYEYPPLIICPGKWVNADKAMAMGLSNDAIKYSLAFATVHAVDSETDVDAGRSEFLEFYNARNYESFFDYLQDISIDIRPAHWRALLAPSSNVSTGYACYRCHNHSEALEKVFVDNRMCYVVQFQPEKDKRFRNWNFVPEVIIKVQDSTKDIINLTSQWRSYVMPDKLLRQPHWAYITLTPYEISTLKLTTQRFVSISSENFPCLKNDETIDKYSRIRCITNCLHDVYMNEYKCGLFPYAPYDEDQSPSEYCNYYDLVGKVNLTHFESWARNDSQILDSKDAEECVEQCPHRCDRKFYTTILDSRLPIPGVVATDAQTSSMLGVRIDHISVTQGGVMTLTEIRTLSFAGLISKLGGTLGLFVGGSIMSIFQIILFVVNYILDLRQDRKIRAELKVVSKF